jgi:hypothetical protein
MSLHLFGQKQNFRFIRVAEHISQVLAVTVGVNILSSCGLVLSLEVITFSVANFVICTELEAAVLVIFVRLHRSCHFCVFEWGFVMPLANVVRLLLSKRSKSLSAVSEKQKNFSPLKKSFY